MLPRVYALMDIHVTVISWRIPPILLGSLTIRSRRGPHVATRKPSTCPTRFSPPNDGFQPHRGVLGANDGSRFPDNFYLPLHRRKASGWTTAQRERPLEMLFRREVIRARPGSRTECCDQDSQERPFGGNVDDLMSALFTTRTKLTVFRPAQSPLHRSSLNRLSSSLNSGTQKPALCSFCSASFRSTIRSSALLVGRPGRRWDLISSSSSSSRAI
jgi:hypothetical protein